MSIGQAIAAIRVFEIMASQLEYKEMNDALGLDARLQQGLKTA
jgi:hypothetical protein